MTGCNAQYRGSNFASERKQQQNSFGLYTKLKMIKEIEPNGKFDTLLSKWTGGTASRLESG